jgi:hypothetical protein
VLGALFQCAESAGGAPGIWGCCLCDDYFIGIILKSALIISPMALFNHFMVFVGMQKAQSTTLYIINCTARNSRLFQMFFLIFWQLRK